MSKRSLMLTGSSLLALSALLLAGALTLPDRPPRDKPPAPGPRSAPPAPAGAHPDVIAAAALTADAAPRRLPDGLPLATPAPGAPLRVANGESLRLPADVGVQTIHLAFDSARRGDAAYPVTVYGEDGARLELPGVADDGGVIIALNSADLTAGRYLVQLATREYTPTPVRRFVIEIPHGGNRQ